MGRRVLHPGRTAAVSRLARCLPAAPVARFVEFSWLVRWHPGGRPPYETKVLAHPDVHLVLEEPEPLVYGVDRGLFVRRLEGTGRVLGAKFRPGAFRSFITGPVAEFADRRVPAAELFGPEAAEAGRAVLGADSDADSDADMVARAEAFLLHRLPSPDPAADEVAAMVERITAEPTMFRVDQAAAALDVPVRRLQRLFAEYVGAGPEWVLRRALLHEAAARADQGSGLDWASLAAELGYADQAHMTRDFTAAVGVPPAWYAGA